MACLIINHLISENDFKINGAAVIPQEEKVFSSAQTAVSLELGNIKIPRANNFITKPVNIADAIYGALGEYYS